MRFRWPGVQPDGAFFTDDMEDFVRAAEALGWQGHVFGGARGLALRLTELGFQVPVG